MARVLVVEDNESMREVIRISLTESAHTTLEAENAQQARAILEAGRPDLVISDLRLPGDGDGFDVLRASKAALPDVEVIIITAHGSISDAVEAMRLGAHDFIEKPFSVEELDARVDRALKTLRLHRENRDLRESLREEWGNLVGVSSALRDVQELITRIADAPTPVLITGESGTGKELVARAIHEHSPRSKRPFVAVNCAALSESLLESELFGHEQNAFTGASFQKKGRFEMADTGTLFLDEIGEVPPWLQIKLLRVLQDMEFERVGGEESLKVDVRLLCATNRDLKRMIEEGSFREDLYYRINVLSVHLPPLSERREDIGPLVEHFLDKYNMRLHKSVTCAPETLALLCMHPWPGNVRELENVVERGVVLARAEVLEPGDLPEELRASPLAEVVASGEESGNVTEQVRIVERELLRRALVRNNWNQTRAARDMGMGRTSLQYKMKKYGLSPGGTTGAGQ